MSRTILTTFDIRCITYNLSSVSIAQTARLTPVSALPPTVHRHELPSAALSSSCLAPCTGYCKYLLQQSIHYIYGSVALKIITESTAGADGSLKAQSFMT